MRSVFTSYLSFTVNILVTIVLTPYLVYYLGQSGYGLWATLGSVLGYLGLLDLGLSHASTKFVAEYKAVNDVDGLNELVATVFVTHFITGSMVFGMSILLSFYVPEFFQVPTDLATTGRLFFLIAGANLALGFPLSPLSGIIFGHQRIDVLNLINIFGSLCNCLFSILVLKMGLGLVGVAWVAFAVQLLAAALKWFFIRCEFPEVILRLRLFNTTVLKRTLSFSLYFFVMSIGTQIVFNTDNIVIGKFLGIATVTAYAVAFRLSHIAMQFIFKIADVLFPVFSELYTLGEKDRLKTICLESSKISVAMAIPVVIIIILFGEEIIRIWVGQKNFVGMPTLAVLAALTFMHSLIHPGAVMLSGIGRVRTMTFFNIAEAILNLALSLALVKPLGVLGVALGTVIAQALTNLWYIPSSAVREVDLSLWSYSQEVLLKPMLAGLPAGGMGIFLFRLLPDAGIVTIVLFCIAIFLTYGLGFFAIGITGEERTVYRERIRCLAKVCSRFS